MSHYSPDNLLPHRQEDFLIVLPAQQLVDLRQLICDGMLQDSNRDFYSLQILSTGIQMNVEGPHSAIVEDGLLYEWDVEVDTLAVYLFLKTPSAVHDERLVARVHYVCRGVDGEDCRSPQNQKIEAILEEFTHQDLNTINY